MKKTIAIAVLALVAGIAQANSYAYQETKRETCADMGKYAVFVWTRVENGQEPPRVSEGKRSLGAFRPLFRYADEQMTKYHSDYNRDSAFRAGWANCMGKIDDLIRDSKYGITDN